MARIGQRGDGNCGDIDVVDEADASVAQRRAQEPIRPDAGGEAEQVSGEVGRTQQRPGQTRILQSGIDFGVPAHELQIHVWVADGNR